MRKGRAWEARNAFANRQELIKARLTRRDLMKLGLLTSTGYLVAKNGLSARASGDDTPHSPPTTPFIVPLPIPSPRKPPSRSRKCSIPRRRRIRSPERLRGRVTNCGSNSCLRRPIGCGNGRACIRSILSCRRPRSLPSTASSRRRYFTPAMANRSLSVWVTNFFGGTVTELQANDGAVLGSRQVGDGAADIAFDGVNIWVANSGNSNVKILRPGDGAVLATVPVGRSPMGLEVSVTLGTTGIWVASFGTDSVTWIDPRQLLSTR
jgi:hypothetical protein